MPWHLRRLIDLRGGTREPVLVRCADSDEQGRPPRRPVQIGNSGVVPVVRAGVVLYLLTGGSAKVWRLALDDLPNGLSR